MRNKIKEIPNQTYDVWCIWLQYRFHTAAVSLWVVGWEDASYESPVIVVWIYSVWTVNATQWGTYVLACSCTFMFMMKEWYTLVYVWYALLFVKEVTSVTSNSPISFRFHLKADCCIFVIWWDDMYAHTRNRQRGLLCLHPNTCIHHKTWRHINYSYWNGAQLQIIMIWVDVHIMRWQD